MAEKTTIARPYAKAAFREAQADKHLGAWSETLRAAATAVRDPRVNELLSSPSIGGEDLAQFVMSVTGETLDEHAQNFFRTLAENHRLGYIPEISALFDEYKDEAESVVDVTVTSAAPIDTAQQQALSKALERKLKRSVRLHCDTDSSLIGGAVLRAGDTVIDGSLLSRLKRIAFELTA
ncbi:MAG TPA: F0F1 ATP synthase subunit delta [Steroidobacteraceae bacterium]|nr:F0F1 ATP synthase subunit delta [Steroidobacteraceae bacterium]